MIFEPELGSGEVKHYRSLEALIQEVQFHIDLDFILFMVAYLGRLMSVDSASEIMMRKSRRFSVFSQVDERSKSQVIKLLRARLSVPEHLKGTSLVYLELFHHSSIILHTEVLLGQQRKAIEFETAPLDESLVTGLELLGTGFVQYFLDVARRFANLHPTFVFNEVLLTHFFDSPSVLARTMMLSIRQQALTQSYKVLGSLDILGNPISMVNRMGNGVVEVIFHTDLYCNDF